MLIAHLCVMILFRSLQDSSIWLSGADVNQAKDEFKDLLSCHVYHSTIGVFHQPVGRVFTYYTFCALSNIIFDCSPFVADRHKRKTPWHTALKSTIVMLSLCIVQSLLYFGFFVLWSYAHLARISNSRLILWYSRYSSTSTNKNTPNPIKNTIWLFLINYLNDLR